jgi:hypothetical protein
MFAIIYSDLDVSHIFSRSKVWTKRTRLMITAKAPEALKQLREWAFVGG